jgi:hypothetical protein
MLLCQAVPFPGNQLLGTARDSLTFCGHGCRDGKVSFALFHQGMGLKVLEGRSDVSSDPYMKASRPTGWFWV